MRGPQTRRRPDKVTAAPRAASSRFVYFLDGLFSAFIEAATRFSRGQAVRRAQQQPHGKPVFELRDRLGNGGLADAQLLRRTGERAGIDDADERFHRGEAVHPYSLEE